MRSRVSDHQTLVVIERGCGLLFARIIFLSDSLPEDLMNRYLGVAGHSLAFDSLACGVGIGGAKASLQQLGIAWLTSYHSNFCLGLLGNRFIYVSSLTISLRRVSVRLLNNCKLHRGKQDNKKNEKLENSA